MVDHAWNNNLVEFKQAIKIIFPGDINCLNQRGQSALYCAAYKGNIEIMIGM
jgi:hypothetical protein